MQKFQILENILDKICEEAPADNKVYKTKKDDQTAIDKARSLAYIHLFLNARFGLVNFTSRIDNITDGSDDGGVDAYYIDDNNKVVYFIQSKWRINAKNMVERNIGMDELAKMELDLILKGSPSYFDNSGNKKDFCGKIKAMQNKIKKIKDIRNFKKEIIILSNVQADKKTLKKLLGDYVVDVYNYKRIYDEILFSYLSGIYYNPDSIDITLNVVKDTQYVCEKKIISSVGECRILLCFVSLDQIAEVLNKYKNAILKYNPRNYLGLSENPDSVNNSIKRSILREENDFAIFNNGITILTKQLDYDPLNCKENIVDLRLIEPQIINGGQTAYTVNQVYKDKVFGSKLKDKELLLKIIEISEENEKFMGDISKSANKQSVVEEDDRKSNDLVQKDLQRKIYSEFGYLYERKKGEFFEVTKSKSIDKNLIINKRILAKSYFAFIGCPSEARNEGYKKIFGERYSKIFLSAGSFRKMLYAYFGLKIVEKKSSKSKGYDIGKYGHAIQYGKFAVVYALSKYFQKNKDYNDIKNLKSILDQNIDIILSEWKKFEKDAIADKDNLKYFGKNKKDFDNYYKGNTLNSNLQDFFRLKIK